MDQDKHQLPPSGSSPSKTLPKKIRLLGTHNLSSGGQGSSGPSLQVPGSTHSHQGLAMSQFKLMPGSTIENGFKQNPRLRSPNVQGTNQLGKINVEQNRTITAEDKRDNLEKLKQNLDNQARRKQFYSSDRAHPNEDINQYNTPQFDKRLRPPLQNTGLATIQPISPKNMNHDVGGPLTVLKCLQMQKDIPALKNVLVDTLEQVSTGQKTLRQSFDNRNAEKLGKTPQIMKSRSPPQTSGLLPSINKTPQVASQKIEHIQRYNTGGTASNSLNRSGHQTGLSPNLLRNGAHIIANSMVQNNNYVIPQSTQRQLTALPGSTRQDSCERTINNTNTSLIGMVLQQWGRHQVVNTERNEYGLKGESSMGKVLATKGSRTGILMKSGQKATYQPYAGSALPGGRYQTEPQTTQGSTTNSRSVSKVSQGGRGRSQGRTGATNSQVREPSKGPQDTQITNYSRLFKDDASWGSQSGDEEETLNTKNPIDSILKNYRDSSGRRISTKTNTSDIIKVQNQEEPSTTKTNLESAANSDDETPTNGTLPKIQKKGKTAALKANINMPFDFKKIKVIVKKGNSEKDSKEELLDREWVQKNDTIPHFANVLKGVSKNEGVEITMNCNHQAFLWIIRYVKAKTNGDDLIDALKKEWEYPPKKQVDKINEGVDQTQYEYLDEIDSSNCLNVLVTAYFLQLFWVYNAVWDYYFSRNFCDVINSCQISLSNINPAIVKDISRRIPDIYLERITDRKDKFISNVYKARCEVKIVKEYDPKDVIGGEDQTGDLAELGRRFMSSQADISSQKLYYCKVCKNIMTQGQALKISCVNQKVKSGNVSSKTFFTSQVEDETAESTEEQECFVNTYGQVYYPHDIIFDEEVPYIAEENIHDKDSTVAISSSQPINVDNFIKFFREKYRLCWKEIYLKFSALMFKAEQCKHCREWFQMSQIAGCLAQVPEGENETSQEKLKRMRFHEIDFEDVETDNSNGFTRSHYEIYKKEVQVIDNIFYPDEKRESDGKEENRAKSHIEILIENYKDQLEFVEPQSMNYDIKINEAYLEFETQTKFSHVYGDKTVYTSGVANGHKRSQNEISSFPANQIELYNKNGQRLERLQDHISDLIFNCAGHWNQIESKLKDSSFMKKLQKDCENYVKENPEQFQRSETRKAKFDLSENKMIENKTSKKKSGLDSQQTAAAQALVIKRFNKTKRLIIVTEDEIAQKALSNSLLLSREQDPDSEEPQKDQKNSNIDNLNTIAANRHRSPMANKSGDVKIGNLNTQNCELVQAGVKIFSDIKQITVKRPQNSQRKGGPPSIAATGGAARKNFLQRNIARSQGARSGSNQAKKDDQGSNVGTPTQKTRQQMNSASRVVNNGNVGIKANASQEFSTSKPTQALTGNNLHLPVDNRRNMRSPGPGVAAAGGQNNLANAIQNISQVNSGQSASMSLQVPNNMLNLGLPTSGSSNTTIQPPQGNILRVNRSPVLKIRPSKIDKNQVQK